MFCPQQKSWEVFSRTFSIDARHFGFLLQNYSVAFVWCILLFAIVRMFSFLCVSHGLSDPIGRWKCDSQHIMLVCNVMEFCAMDFLRLFLLTQFIMTVSSEQWAVRTPVFPQWCNRFFCVVALNDLVTERKPILLHSMLYELCALLIAGNCNSYIIHSLHKICRIIENDNFGFRPVYNEIYPNE